MPTDDRKRWVFGALIAGGLIVTFVTRFLIGGWAGAGIAYGLAIVIGAGVIWAIQR